MASVVSEPVIGPLAPFAEGFTAQLANRSYSMQAIKSHRGLLVHLSQWLAERGLGVRELTPEVATKFLQMRRDTGLVTKVSDRGLRPLVSYLRELGELCEPSVISSPSEELVERFRRYQLEERGLTPDVVSNYARVARMFIGTCSEFISVSLTELSAPDVSAFVLDQCGRRSVADAHNVISGLRALLGSCTSRAGPGKILRRPCRS